MFDEVRREFVEVIREIDLALEGSEGVRDRATALHGDEPSDGAAGTLDDDFLAAFGEVDQPRELALGFVHSDANHAMSLAPVS